MIIQTKDGWEVENDIARSAQPHRRKPARAEPTS
jgi:hypothetical protein